MAGMPVLAQVAVTLSLLIAIAFSGIMIIYAVDDISDGIIKRKIKKWLED